MFGLFAVADEFILTLFGSKWEHTIFLFKVLCFVGMLQSIGTTVGQIYLAKGKTDWMFRWGVFSAILIVCAIAFGLLWGIKGVAISYAIAALILAYPNFAIPFRLIELKVKTFVQNIKIEFLTSVIMVIGVLISVMIQRNMSIDPAIILLSNILLGLGIYILITKRINSSALSEIQGMVWGKKGKQLT
jgi:PST family polysaccharide transporter